MIRVPARPSAPRIHTPRIHASNASRVLFASRGSTPLFGMPRPDPTSECSTDLSAEALPDDALVQSSVRLMKGFADETRLKILCLLRDGEACVHEIVDALDVSQSGVSHQLRVLRDAQLVGHRREGRHVYYRLADAHVREMLSNALSHGAEAT